ncbi:MAG: hypothetical protein WD336_11390, partial [Trueperaceae bacterium]
GLASAYDECVRACHLDFLGAIRDGRDALNHAAEAAKSVEFANALFLGWFVIASQATHFAA